MKKRKQQKFNLHSYTAFAGTLLSAVAVTGQVTYTDIDPDVVLTGDDFYYELDLDDDGTTDFDIVRIETGFIAEAAITPSSASNFIGGYDGTLIGSDGFLAYAINGGAEIGGGMNFGGSDFAELLLLFAGSHWGAWNNVTDKYAALQFKIGSATYYGWVRMNVNSGSVTIKDYAYNATADASITTPPGGVAIQEQIISEPYIYAADNTIHIQNIDGNSPYTTEVYNMQGELIYTKEINSAYSEISMQGFTNGIYIVKIKSGDKLFSKTIML